MGGTWLEAWPLWLCCDWWFVAVGVVWVRALVCVGWWWSGNLCLTGGCLGSLLLRGCGYWGGASL